MTTITIWRRPVLAWSYQPPRGTKKRMILLDCGDVEERPWDEPGPDVVSCGTCRREGE